MIIHFQYILIVYACDFACDYAYRTSSKTAWLFLILTHYSLAVWVQLKLIAFFNHPTWNAFVRFTDKTAKHSYDNTAYAWRSFTLRLFSAAVALQSNASEKAKEKQSLIYVTERFTPSQAIQLDTETEKMIQVQSRVRSFSLGSKL